MKESEFQKSLIKRLKHEFPGCIILKNDPNYLQGVPDLIFLWDRFWAALECKKDKKAKHQPNQDHYVKLMNKMSFATFVYPGNADDVIKKMKNIAKRREKDERKKSNRKH